MENKPITLGKIEFTLKEILEAIRDKPKSKYSSGFYFEATESTIKYVNELIRKEASKILNDQK